MIHCQVFLKYFFVNMIESDKRYITSDEELVVEANNLHSALKSNRYKASFVNVLENGLNFEDDYVLLGFKSPFYLKSCRGLGMKMHSIKDDLENLVEICGRDRIVPVVDSVTQKTENMTFGNFVKEFEKQEKCLNLISLEVSDTCLDRKVLGPKKVYEIDWVNNTYPDLLKDNRSHIWGRHPKIAKYCLLSSKGSFTDFHIDFGGASVWYHVLKGKKIFWLVEPTEKNLQLYKDWKLKPSDGRFFGDIVKECQKVELEEKSLFLMPSGWIHAVYTPEKSVVFGGNFLHFDDVEMQLRITKLQNEAMNIPVESRFPHLEQLHWYVADHVVRCCGGRSFIDQSVLSKSRNIKKVGEKKLFSASQIIGLDRLASHLSSKRNVIVEGINDLVGLYTAFSDAVLCLSNPSESYHYNADNYPLAGFRRCIKEDKATCKFN